MDPYEILGVRPNAGSEEIELAYKGRRSQYHPDRYGQSDADTRAWATGKMQEVNAAYETLTKPDARARWDRQKAQPSRASADTTSSAPQGARTTPEQPAPGTLGDWLRNHAMSRWSIDHIHFAPKIPNKKLHAALASYGVGIAPDQVAVLIDNTVFGGAKEGALITDKELRFKEIFTPTVVMPVRNLEYLMVDGRNIHVNGVKVMNFNMPEKDHVESLLDAINGYIKAGKPANPSSSRSSSRARDVKALYAEFQQTEVLDEVISEVAELRSSGEASKRLVVDLGLGLMHLTKYACLSIIPREVRDRDVQSVLASDASLFETLVFVLAIAFGVLLRQLGEERAAQQLLQLYMHTLIPYLIIREDLDAPFIGLSDQEIDAVLRQSAIMPPLAIRTRRYLEAVLCNESPADMYLANLRDPLDFLALDEEIRPVLGAYVRDHIPAPGNGSLYSASLQEVISAVQNQVENYLLTRGARR